jgi:hypothetical protein
MELSMKLCLGLWEENYKGNEFIYTAKPENFSNFKKEISKISDKATDVQPYPLPLVNRLVATNVEVLELTSTLVYFIDQGKGIGGDEKGVKARAREETEETEETLKLKPHLKGKNISSGKIVRKPSTRA